jgi:hypothetical protein
VLLSLREGRAKLVDFAHMTHFPTLTNMTRRSVAWPDLPPEPDESGGCDSTKQPEPDLPVRETSLRYPWSKKILDVFF